MNKKQKPIVLAIMDGWGVGAKDPETNAIEAAKTPFYDHLLRSYPNTTLKASGVDVGLEKDQMSGSETGHLNIGAGRIVKQEVRTILEEINDGKFFQNPVFLSTISHIKKTNTAIHLMGLMGSSDSPHSHPDIFLALLLLLKKHDVKNVFFHLFTDGRDSFPKSALEHWGKWEKMISNVGIGKLATVSGRFYAMDRTKNWERLIRAYDAMTKGDGIKAKSMEEAIEKSYKIGNTDEFLEPTVITEKGKPVAKIKEGDGIIFFNFRSDRARELSKFFVGTKIREETDVKIKNYKNLSFVAMTDFGPDLNLKTAYSSSPIINTMPSLLGNYRQLYISGTEKYAHVTYFINGGYPDPVGGEERIIVPSPSVRSYAEKPEMASEEITELIEQYLENDIYSFIVVNFPNADMVGHTGNYHSTIRAVEIIDQKLKRIYSKVASKNGVLIVTADHGNADIIVDPESNRPSSFHTKNPVPFIVASEGKEFHSLKLRDNGKLANILPTILEIAGIDAPEGLEESLIEK
ncbi:MAG: 2,3-bisphosphoglycerate-independent phosphoglycerate mutase [Patescibacteria group bacterium]|jgi:2,3-bisphosphoglycerate-independent phosphoglycerate mutase|nr:2,3-bisphosphoglycerate-independent phosphoglycerate mutase [Patescibacteria group bacterium]